MNFQPKQISSSRKLFTASLLCFSTVFSVQSYAQSTKAELDAKGMVQLFDGFPQLGKTKLDSSAYINVQTKKLAKPGIAYVNWKAIEAILKKLGYENPPTHLTPDLTRKILNVAGYAVPAAGESKDAYLEQFRMMFAERYGGYFLNGNFGSGRAASNGRVQSKGVGRTKLVRPWSDASHASGTANLNEGIHEAIWSVIFEQELPLGSNPVLFLITTGTLVDPSNPNSEPRTLIIREDPLRPAHFQHNPTVLDPSRNDIAQEHIDAEHERMSKLMPEKFLNALPYPPQVPKGLSAGELFRVGFFELIDRICLQYAAAHARQIYHGATSTSNIEIGGRFLDFGTTTSVIGYGLTRFLQSESPNGRIDNLKSDIFLELAIDFRNILPPSLQNFVPTNEEITRRADEKFGQALTEEYLILAGAPREFAKELSLTASGKALFNTMKKISSAGNDHIQEFHDGNAPTSVSHYDLGKVLVASYNQVIGVQTTTTARLQTELNASLRDAHLRNELTENYRNFFNDLRTLTHEQGIPEKNLRAYMKIAVANRNTHMPELLFGDAMWQQFFKVSGAYYKNEDPYAVQNLIDQMAERNIHEFKAGAFKIEVANKHTVEAGLSIHTIFDLKSGTTTTVEKTLPGFLAAAEDAKEKGLAEPAKSQKPAQVSCAQELGFSI